MKKTLIKKIWQIEKQRPHNGTTNIRNLTGLDCLILLYLLIPTFLYIMFYLILPVAIGCIFLLLLTFFHISFRKPLPQSKFTIIGIIFVSLLVCFSSGVLGYFRPPFDWYKHYAILETLRSSHIPPVLSFGTEFVTLRYYLGFYILPAVLSKFLNFDAARIFLFIWMSVGVFLAMIKAIEISEKKGGQAIAFVIIILSFAGLGVLGIFVLNHRIYWFSIEWWSGLFNYHSILYGLNWSPQHAIPSLLAGVILWDRNRRLAWAPYIGLLFVGLVVWSPFVAIGSFLLLLATTNSLEFRYFFSKWNILIALFFLPIFYIYYTHHLVGIDTPVSMVWNYQKYNSENLITFSWSRFFLFLFFEVYIVCFLIAFIQPTAKLLMFKIATLLTIILFIVAGFEDDWAMRVSETTIVFLACSFAVLLINVRQLHWYSACMLLAYFIIAFAAPVAQINRALFVDYNILEYKKQFLIAPLMYTIQREMPAKQPYVANQLFSSFFPYPFRQKDTTWYMGTVQVAKPLHVSGLGLAGWLHPYYGWSANEAMGTWSEAKKVYLPISFCTSCFQNGVMLRFRSGAMLYIYPQVKVKVYLNNRFLTQWVYDRAHPGRTDEIIVAPENMQHGSLVTFKINPVTDFGALPHSKDSRTLGFIIDSIDVIPIH